MTAAVFPTADSSQPSLHLTTTSAHSTDFVPNGSPARLTLSQSRKSCQTTPDFGQRSRKRARVNEDATVRAAASSKPRRNTRAVKRDQHGHSVSQEPESPFPMTNTQYDLAGGLDTPSAARLDEEERRDMELQMKDYRINRFNQYNPNTSSEAPLTPSSGAGLRGRKRARSTDQATWGRVVMSAVGGVAGKVIDFCWNNGAFRGFRAGGGQGYSLDPGTPTLVEQSSWSNVNGRDDVFNSTNQNEHANATLIPGQFPEEVFIPEYMSQPWSHKSLDHTTPAPIRQGNCLDENWVFVKTPDTLDRSVHRPPHDSRYSRASELGSSTSNSAVRAGRPQLKPSRTPAGNSGSRLNRPASFASPRASPGRPSERVDASRSPTRAQMNQTPRTGPSSPRRPATHAGARKSCGTPTSPEFQRYEKRMRRIEREEDESLSRLNSQLQNMIKAGKEALGTTIEVNLLDDCGRDGWA